MRRFVIAVLAVVAGSLALPTTAWAAESIPSYDVVVTIDADTSMSLEETITYDFDDSADRHGIYRDLVTADDDVLGRTRLYGVQVADVLMDGSPVPFATEQDGSMLRVRIGDPDVTITGAHTYVIRYTVENGLRVITEDDVADPDVPDELSVGDVELFWDLIENTFGVPIDRASATVRGPADAIAGRCLVGDAGSTDDCALTVDRDAVIFGPTSLADGQFLTAVLDYPAAAFTAVPRENFASRTPLLIGIVVGAVLFVALLIVPITLATLWRRRDRGVIISGTPVQFEPPDGLAAAPMAAAWKGTSGSIRSRVLVATLLDLAARGFLTIDDERTVTVRRLDRGRDEANTWERPLLNALFAHGDQVELEEYDQALADAWTSTLEHLTEDAEKAGRRNPEGGAPDRRWNVLFGVTAAGVAGVVIGAVAGWSPLLAASIGIASGSILGALIARAITPRRETQQSATFNAAVLGFERLMSTDAAEARRAFAQRSGLPAHAILATLLPYAVVFDLAESWLGAFPDLTPDELRATGINVASVAAIGSLVDHAASSASSAMTAPSSGSGSGGSAGGGGGGGGGGAW